MCNLCNIHTYTHKYAQYTFIKVHTTFILQRQYTPLLKASENGWPEVVETLLKAGANIEAKNDVS